MLNIRVGAKLEAKVRRIARARKLTKSQVVREALDAFPEKEPTAYDLMKDGIGIIASGDGTLSQNTGERFARMLREERERKRKRGHGHRPG